MAIDIRDIRDMDHIMVTQDISSIDIRSISFALPRWGKPMKEVSNGSTDLLQSMKQTIVGRVPVLGAWDILGKFISGGFWIKIWWTKEGLNGGWRDLFGVEEWFIPSLPSECGYVCCIWFRQERAGNSNKKKTGSFTRIAKRTKSSKPQETRNTGLCKTWVWLEKCERSWG